MLEMNIGEHEWSGVILRLMGSLSVPGAVSTVGDEDQELKRPILTVWAVWRTEAHEGG